MDILAGIVVIIACGLGVLLTVVGLPGTWLMLLGALLVKGFWIDGMFGWWTLGVCGILAVAAEIAEGASAGVGAARSGASKRAAIGAIVGGLLGAIVGTPLIPVPIVGTIVGGAIGAGVGALALELTVEPGARRSTSYVAVARGAAVGRLLATVVKGAFAIVIALVLTVAVLV